ncbi:hypothetical protein BX661DRAFT_200034 [Kickxella alabastrina]|uniref:uncharacterized protein n=1 Tax=Kickxella alabastrina TaxID=61397 RepID=UPI00222076C6|nr:uncharacterized protein BX661DRAFT_200034 [Kickxella alabastrina]KAI7823693.1 hypothetical protein BX661DRAFT_200034 [Kickxella alabastrina]
MPVPALLRFACDDYICLLVPASIADHLQLCRWFSSNNAAPQVIEDIAARTHGKIASEIFSIIAAHTRVKQRQQQTATNSVTDAPLRRWLAACIGVISLKRLGIKPPREVLLHRPPETAKIMMARAAATDISANLIAMAILDMIKGEVGESGKALASAFESAKRSPGIVGKKLILQLFLEMDNISKDTSVVILAGTSAPHLMDESILRAGKLDKIMHMPRPGYASRLDILKHATRNLAVEDTDTLFTWLVELEMSRAELKGLILRSRINDH